MDRLIGDKRDVRLGQTNGLPWTNGVFVLDKQFVGEYNGYFFSTFADEKLKNTWLCQS